MKGERLASGGWTHWWTTAEGRRTSVAFWRVAGERLTGPAGQQTRGRHPVSPSWLVTGGRRGRDAVRGDSPLRAVASACSSWRELVWGRLAASLMPEADGGHRMACCVIEGRAAALSDSERAARRLVSRLVVWR
ncbi:uncharacterized protein LOC122387268 isoform X2 [Amphibalanus amphitrite]|uniref:uncharacterized protein LOC122387268 isoform X2 n=1 Tax=Amphibalanus amphitrite TaxID=1232801 RepID=UPI001C926E38|nr:uncharacterized protein LOC122387268 isoform X2 [Amphibalanus amphitrite]